jgi:glycosyl transferase family 25
MSNNIDKIYYINMDKRTDRRVDIERELKEYELDAERFVGIPYEPGIVGCGKSHLAVMKMAKANGYKNVLILEDDFTFLVPKEEFERKLDLFFQTVPNYDVCMLCCNLVEKDPSPKYRFLDQIVEASNACAYIVNGHYLDTLIELYENALPLLESTGAHWIYANDQVWKPLQKKDIWYLFNPRLGKQKSGYSDNAKRVMDYDT